MDDGVQGFEVEQAGCDSCAVRVRDAVAPLATVRGIDVNATENTATVRIEPNATVSEEAVNRALADASGAGHSYRVKPGSWRADASRFG